MAGEANRTRRTLIGISLLLALSAPGLASVCGDGIVEGWEECDEAGANGVGRCCSEACILVDTDVDTVCDALDPCTSPAPIGLSVDRLRITRRGGHDALVFRGVVTVPGGGLDLASTGLRLVVSQIYYVGILLDLTVPGGPRWRGTANGGMWRYRDPAGLAGGITAVTVKRSPLTDAVALSIRGRHDSYALLREALPAKLAVTFAPGTPETELCGESWLARSLCTTDVAAGLDCLPPPPIRLCSGDPDQLVRCDVRNAASAQEQRFMSAGWYFAGDCNDLPGFTGSPGVTCSTASTSVGFQVSTAHGSATHFCEWVSDPAPGAPTMTCEEWPPPGALRDSARSRR